MKIKLNMDLHGHKKGEIIDLDICSKSDARYWRRSIKDSKIDKSVSEISDKQIEEERKIKLEKRLEEKKEKEKAEQKAKREAKKKSEININNNEV